MIKKLNRYFYKGDLIFSSHNQIAKMIINLNSNKVLDIGCHKGFIGQTLRERNWCGDIVGLDKNNIYRQTILNKDYQKFLHLDIEKDIGAIKEQFDTIVFADVLEHLNNPLKTLINAQTLILDKHYFIISLPNIANFYIRLLLLLGNFDYANSGILDRDHRHFFTLKTARKLIKNAGLKTIKTYATPIPFPLLSQRPLLKKPFLLLYLIAKLILPVRKELLSYQFIFLCKKDSPKKPSKKHYPRYKKVNP